MQEFDIAVIGGGPAGSSAALYLARNGFNVCLIEKKSFPREVVCGEFISYEAIDILKELNIYNDFIGLSPNPISSFKLHCKDELPICAKFPFQAYGMKRSTFDNLLLTSAMNAGVTVIQPAEVKKILRDKDNFHLYMSDTSVKADFVIAAYGKQNALDKFLSRDFSSIKSKLNGIKFHLDKKFFINMPDDEIIIFAGRGYYCGINVVNENSAAICFLLDQTINSLPPKQQFISIVNSEVNLKMLLVPQINNVVEDLIFYGTGNIYFGKKRVIENGIIMAGDSAGMIAPLAGDGIGMALQTSKLIFKLLSSFRRKEISRSQMEKMYHKEWESTFKKRLRTALFLQSFFLKPSLQDIGLKVIKYLPSLTKRFIAATRN